MHEAPDLNARLAALAERRASAKPAEPTPATAPTTGKRKRRHAAPAARILSGGLSASALIALVTTIAAGDMAQEAGASTTATRPAVTRHTVPAKVVVRERHHVQYVDRNGQPVAPPALGTAAAATAPTASRRSQPGATRPPAGASPPATPTFAPVATPISVPAGNSGSAPSAPPTPGNKGSNPPATTPGTAPPVTVTPTTLAPPPPPPPPCSGSKC